MKTGTELESINKNSEAHQDAASCKLCCTKAAFTVSGSHQGSTERKTRGVTTGEFIKTQKENQALRHVKTQYDIRMPQEVLWWRRRESNPRPKTNIM